MACRVLEGLPDRGRVASLDVPEALPQGLGEAGLIWHAAKKSHELNEIPHGEEDWKPWPASKIVTVIGGERQ